VTIEEVEVVADLAVVDQAVEEAEGKRTQSSSEHQLITGFIPVHDPQRGE
jgi:hypothetical protein